MNALGALLALLVAFVLGSLPWSQWTARRRGIDLRREGSGNLGATNVYRVMGWKWGLGVLLLDVGKGVLAVAVARTLSPGGGLPAAAALAAVAGHAFSPFAGFRGGKGVATGLGVLLGLAPAAGILSFLVWLAVVGLCGWISVASGTAALLLPVFVVLTRQDLGLRFGWVLALSLALCILVLVRHRANWGRVVRGVEQPIWGRGPEAPSPEPASPEAPSPEAAAKESS
jgi:glycerol-3-phosphate acyltransferase PlsY